MKNNFEANKNQKPQRQTVIFKWNPAVSSYEFLCFLNNIASEDGSMDWSVWDHDKIKQGDRFFMLKVGPGTCGIVSAGTITSDPVPDEDWSGRGREVYYCDYYAEFMVNPETLPIIGTAQLQASIPDFDWTGGHSGVVLPVDHAKILNQLYTAYLRENAPVFADRFDLMKKRRLINDQLYLERKLRRKLIGDDPEED